MDVVTTLKSYLEVIHQKFGVRRIGIFGSFARGEEKEETILMCSLCSKKSRKLSINILI